jgi:hypothetical protein
MACLLCLLCLPRFAVFAALVVGCAMCWYCVKWYGVHVECRGASHGHRRCGYDAIEEAAQRNAIINDNLLVTYDDP